jgi:outer membrane protein assembly factor BamB
MQRSRNVALMLAVGALCAGCSLFSWLPFVGSKAPGPDEPAELTKYKPEVSLKQIWSAKIGKGLGEKYLRLPPGVLADRIFATDANGHVEARERFKGKRIWRHNVETGKKNDQSFVAGGVGVGEGLVLLGDTRAQAIALSAVDGTERWRVQLTSEVLAAPVTGDGVVYLQTSDGRLTALDAVDGHRLWTYDTQVPPLTLRGTGAPAFEGGLVFAGFANGKVGAFRGPTGEPIWEQRVMLPQGRSDLERIVDVDGNLLITNVAVFAASYQGRLVALRPTDGTALWERDTSTYLDLAQGYGNVYVVDDKSVISAVDQRSSNLAWEQRALFRRGLSAAATLGNYLIVGDDEGYLHVIAQSDGRLLGRKKIDGDGIRSRPIVADDIVYCLGNSGKLVALQIEARR